MGGKRMKIHPPQSFTENEIKYKSQRTLNKLQVSILMLEEGYTQL